MVRGAKEMLDQLLAADIPMGLVTNTRRDLTEKALDSIGRHYFSVSVCADEVPSGKPAPDPYLRAAQLLGLNPADCLAIEDSLIGSEAAVLAGCAVLVIPNDIEVPTSARRRRVDTLDQLTPADLRAVHTEIGDLTERSA